VDGLNKQVMFGGKLTNGYLWFFSIVPATDGTMMPGLLRLLGA
jgi:hypothetical protein